MVNIITPPTSDVASSIISVIVDNPRFAEIPGFSKYKMRIDKVVVRKSDNEEMTVSNDIVEMMSDVKDADGNWIKKSENVIKLHAVLFPEPEIPLTIQGQGLVWKIIPEFPNYEMNDRMEVRDKNSGRLSKLSRGQYHLLEQGKQQTRKALELFKEVFPTEYDLMIWVECQQNSAYSVSNDGFVRNNKSNCVLNPYKGNGETYWTVTLNANKTGSVSPTLVHILVCTAFHGPKPSSSHEVNHINGDIHDHKASNLEWVTHEKNMQHAANNGLIKRHSSPGGRNFKDDDSRDYTNEVWEVLIVEGQRTMYKASNMGRVKNYIRGNKETPLEPTVTNDGYYRCTLSLPDKKKKMFVHQIVALAFHPNPYNHPMVDHINRDKKNNDEINLKWVSAQENSENGVAKKVGQFDKNGNCVKTYSSVTKAAAAIDVKQCIITGSVDAEFLNDFYHQNSQETSTSKALVPVEATARILALNHLSYNKLETLRISLLALRFNLFPGLKLIKEYIKKNSYQMVPFKSHNAESHLYDDSIAFMRTHLREFLVERCEALMSAESHLHDGSIAFIRTHLREFLVERCEALMSAGNLKIDGRTISISITGDRGKEKSRVGLCNQGPVVITLVLDVLLN
uniref:HNH endonuclease n=1 Tax=Rhabditophanes sp. KR3021 TaxID=114890 RepID=A0AC35TSL3_9BILA